MKRRVLVSLAVLALVLAASAAVVISFSDSEHSQFAAAPPPSTSSLEDSSGLHIQAMTPTLTPSATADPVGTAIRDLLGRLPVEDKIGQMLMFGFAGTTAGADVQEMIRDWRVGGLVLRDANLATPDQILELSTSLQRLAREDGLPAGLLLAVDQEGGAVTRLHPPFTQFPAPAIVGTAGDPDLAQAMGKAMAEEMMAVGINTDLAPVLDVVDNPLNTVIGPRSFGSDPQLVALMGTEFVKGLHDGSVIATGKHFPGHGSTSTDSHYGLPVVSKTSDEIRSTELVPFQAAIETGVDAIMTAHVAYPELDSASLVPATLSKPILTGLLREELGFNRVIITDSMGMGAITANYSPGEAAVMAVEAGADMILASGQVDVQTGVREALLEAVQTGRISEQRIDQSVTRILLLKAKYDVGEEPPFDLDVVGSAEHAKVAEEIVALGN
jgi:beta-N-acetylhexosaminidase